MPFEYTRRANLKCIRGNDNDDIGKCYLIAGKGFDTCLSGQGNHIVIIEIIVDYNFSPTITTFLYNWTGDQ